MFYDTSQIVCVYNYGEPKVHPNVPLNDVPAVH